MFRRYNRRGFIGSHVPGGHVFLVLIFLVSAVVRVAAESPGETDPSHEARELCRYEYGLLCESRDGKQNLKLNFLAQFRFTGLHVNQGPLSPPSPATGIAVDNDFLGFGEARGRFMAFGQLSEHLKYRFFFECATGANCNADQMWGDWSFGSGFGMDFGQFKRMITLQHSLAPVNLVFSDEGIYSRSAGSGLALGIRPYWNYGPVRLSAEIVNDSRFMGGPNATNNNLDSFQYTLGIDFRLMDGDFDWDQMDRHRGRPELYYRAWFSWEAISGKHATSVDFGGGRVINLRDDLVADPLNPISPTCPRYLFLSRLMNGIQQCTGVHFAEDMWNRFYGQGIRLVQSNYGSAALARFSGVSLLLEGNYRTYDFSHSSQWFRDFMYLVEASYMVTPSLNIGFRWEQVLYSDGVIQGLLAGRDPACRPTNGPTAACPKNIPGAPGNETFKDMISWGLAASYLFWDHRLKLTIDYLHFQLPWRVADPVVPGANGLGFPKEVATSLMGLPATGNSNIRKFSLSGDSSPEQVRAQLQVIF